MKKLNHNLKIGDRFNLKPWGWQCEEIPRGEYEITGVKAGYDEIYDYYIKQVDGDYACLIDRRNVEYFAGEDVKPEYDVAYDPEDYQPTEEEMRKAQFITECGDEEFGFWYLGGLENKRRIDSEMISCSFVFTKRSW